jgi:hypothetical protein
MFDDELLSLLAEPTEIAPKLPSTPDTKERFAFLKAKKNGSGWQEGDCWYRMGPPGVTVLKSVK